MAANYRRQTAYLVLPVLVPYRHWPFRCCSRAVASQLRHERAAVRGKDQRAITNTNKSSAN